MKNVKSDFLTTCCFVIAISLAPLGPLTSQAGSAQLRRALAGTVYEGEALAISGKILVSGGQVASQPMAAFGQGWSGNAQLFWGGGQPGAVLDLILDIPEEAIYAVELHMTRAPDYGRLRIQVDGSDVPDIFDGYAPTVVPSGPISVGTFNLMPGPRKVSFMIAGKNQKATGFFAGIDFIRLTKKPVLASQTQQASTLTEITGLTVSPPTTHISDKQMGYLDGEKLTVTCSFKPLTEQPEKIFVIISDNGSQKGVGPIYKLGDAYTKSYFLNGKGPHDIKCAVVVIDPIDQAKQKTVIDERTVSIYVVQKKVQPAEWANNPFIVSPKQNQKMSGGSLVVKPYAPSQSNCADGGYFSLEWQYMESPIAGWKPLKRLSSPWKCVPDGSTKDLSGMKPGLYKVRAKETNGKYNFESGWSEWVTFELLAPK